MSTYAYAKDSPLSAIDPNGELSIAVLGPLGIVGAGIILTSPAGQEAFRSATRAAIDACRPDNPDPWDPCDKYIPKKLLKKRRYDPHYQKNDVLIPRTSVSKFNLCGCRDGRVVLKRASGKNSRGIIVEETEMRWK